MQYNLTVCNKIFCESAPNTWRENKSREGADLCVLWCCVSHKGNGATYPCKRQWQDILFQFEPNSSQCCSACAMWNRQADRSATACHRLHLQTHLVRGAWCCRTISLSVSHHTGWTTLRRITLKLKRNVPGGDTPYNGLYGEAPPEKGGPFSGFRYIKG